MSSTAISSIASIISAPIRWLSKLLGRLLYSSVTALAELIERRVLRGLISVDVIRYAICGFTNYIILDAVLYYMIYHYLIGVDTYINIGVTVVSPHVASLIILFPITFLTGFWLNRHVVFSSTKSGVRRQLFRYALSIVGSIVLSYTLLKVFVDVLGIWATPAKIIGSLITAIYSYLIARLYTFKKDRAGD